jgi:hypothetical protein
MNVLIVSSAQKEIEKLVKKNKHLRDILIKSINSISKNNNEGKGQFAGLSIFSNNL